MEPIERNRSEYARTLCEAIQTGSYQPEPTQAFAVPKPNGGTRIVEQCHPRNLIVHLSLLKLIDEPFDRLLEPSALGYRKGRLREMDIQQVQSALAEGYQYAIETDIEEFFATIDHETLFRLIDSILPKADTRMRELIRKCVQTPYLLRQPHRAGQAEPHLRLRGLPQGSPL